MRLTDEEIKTLISTLHYIEISLDHRFTEERLAVLRGIKVRMQWEVNDEPD